MEYEAVIGTCNLKVEAILPTRLLHPSNCRRKTRIFARPATMIAHNFAPRSIKSARLTLRNQELIGMSADPFPSARGLRVDCSRSALMTVTSSPFISPMVQDAFLGGDLGWSLNQLESRRHNRDVRGRYVHLSFGLLGTL